MHDMTKQNLKNAFAGESQQEGKANIARLFRAIAYAEQVHATGHFKVLGGVGTTADNLATGVEGENFEVNEMYPVYHEDAKFQGEKDAQRSMHYALEAEKIHVGMYADARETVLAGKDIALQDVYICPVCGYTHEGEPEAFCPVCGVKKEMFKKF